MQERRNISVYYRSDLVLARDGIPLNRVRMPGTWLRAVVPEQHHVLACSHIGWYDAPQETCGFLGMRRPVSCSVGRGARSSSAAPLHQACEAAN